MKPLNKDTADVYDSLRDKEEARNRLCEDAGQLIAASDPDATLWYRLDPTA